jgi:adenylate cyclase class 2
MREVELKILDIDVKNVKSKLKALGASCSGTHLMHINIFDYPDGRLLRNGILFRLRTSQGKTVLTLKKHHSSGKFKDSEETEMEVPDVKSFVSILGSLGYVCAEEQEKRRTTYHVNGVEVEIDEYPGVPPYLEIEGPKKNIEALVKKLGFRMSQTTNYTYQQVIKSYGLDPKRLLFQNR